MIRDQDYEQMMNQARVKLTGSSEAGLKGELYDTIKEFLRDSNTWIEWVTLNIVTPEQNYRVTPAQGGMFIRLAVIHDKNWIAMPALMEHTSPPGAIIHLVWPQNVNMQAHAMLIKNLVLPTTRHDIPDAPDWLLPMYETAILDGLLGRMMTQQNKSYSDTTTGQYHLKRFRDGIQVARVAATRSNLYGGQAWRYPASFRQSSQRGGVSTPFPSPSSW